MIKRTIDDLCFYIDEENENTLFLKYNNEIFNYSNMDLDNLFNNIYKFKNEYIPLSVYFELTNSCNFFCPFCYINCGNKSEFIDYEKIIKYIDFLISKGMIHCTLSGGECLLHPFFTEIYTYLKKNGVLVSILTNGSLLKDDTIKLFSQYKPYKIEISIYADSNTKYYNNTLQNKYNLSDIQKNIKKLLEKNINLICKMPLNSITESSFYNIREWCINNNIKFYYSDELFNNYNGISNEEYKLNDNNIKNIINKNNMTIFDKLNLSLCQKKNAFNCKAGKFSLIISYDNKIYPCFEFRQVKNGVFDIVDNNIENAFSSMIRYINKYKDKSICNGCNSYSLCQDCIINKINNSFNCNKYCNERSKILNMRKEKLLNMKNKYITEKLETKRLIIDKGNSLACKKIYEYDMIKCRGIAEEAKLELVSKPIDFIGNDVDKYYNEICVSEKMYDWYIYLKCDNTPIGNVTADREIPDINSIELSFNMHPNYWRKGYMKEAVTKIIDYLFDKGYDNIIMGYDDGNIKSKAFIENMGAKFYKKIENTYVKNNINISTALMIISKEEWLNK